MAAVNVCRAALAPLVAKFVGETPKIQKTGILDEAVRRAGDTAPSRTATIKLFGMSLALPRIDPLRRLTQNKVAGVRAFGKLLWDDRLGFAGGQGLTVRESASRMHTQMLEPLITPLKVEGAKWAERRGIRWRANPEAQANFDKLVYDAVLKGVPEGIEPEVATAARAWGQGWVANLRRQKKLGLMDESVPEDPSYIPRIGHNGNMVRFGRRFGFEGPKGHEHEGGLLMVAVQSILKSQPDLDPRLARVYARGWIQIHRKRTIGLHPSLAAGINLADTQFMKELMDEGLRGIGKTQQEINELRSLTDELLHRVTTRQDRSNAGKPKNARRRIDMDVTLPVTLTDKNGNLETVTLSQVLRTDLRHIALMNTKRLAGHMAFKQHMGKAMTPSQHQAALDDIRVAMADEGITGGEVDGAVQAADVMMRDILGLPVNDAENAGSGLNRAARILRNYNTATTMNLSAFASFVEYAFPMQRGAIKLLQLKVPAFGQFMRDAKTGKIDNATLDFLGRYTGEGAEDLTRPGFNRLDDPDDAVFGLQLDDDGATLLDKAEQLSQKASFFTLEYVSGLLKMTRDTKRTTQLMQLDELATLAEDTSRFKHRVTELGLTPADASKAAKAAKKYRLVGERVVGRDKGVAAELDLQRMRAEDPDGFEALMLAIQRSSDRAVISATAADIPPMFRTTQIGKIVAQFQGFSMAAYTQHFMSPIARRDTQAFISLLYGVMLASMATVSLEVLNNAGRPKKLKENLSLSKVALKSLARSSHASILPMLVDGVSNTAFGSPLFQATTSGRPSGRITSIPTVRTLDAASGFLSGAFGAARGEDVTQATGRAGKSLTPFGNAPVIGGLLNTFTEDLPERK